MTSKHSFAFIFWIFIFLGAHLSLASGTVVGNGGDPLFEFMTATKDSMVETVKLLVFDPKEKSTFCNLKSLSPEKIHFCQEFFNQVSIEILKLSQGEKQTPFVLRDSPLYVEGPDGKPMVVSARTQLGPQGPIEIHRDSVKMLSPTQVLFLLTHEFGHKVLFNQQPVSDNAAIGPFTFGRDLLDAVATSVVQTAKRRGLIGSQFGVNDLFQCTATKDGVSFNSTIKSSRMFLSEDLMSYETSSGKSLLDGALSFNESFNTVIRLKFVITEPKNCASDTVASTLVQIIRATQAAGTTNEDILNTVTIDRNPICPNQDPRFEISYGSVTFACAYFASSSTTTSSHPINGKNKDRF